MDFCLLVDEYLDKAFNFFKSSNSRVGFVATWSLSEAPMSVRERLFPRFYRILRTVSDRVSTCLGGNQQCRLFFYFSEFPTRVELA